jgi:hypothetical protein
MVDEKITSKVNKKAKKTDNRVDDALSGMKSICDYFHRSEPTVLSLVRSSGFPAKKIGGIWESRKSLIDGWREALLNDEGLAG